MWTPLSLPTLLEKIRPRFPQWQENFGKSLHIWILNLGIYDLSIRNHFQRKGSHSLYQKIEFNHNFQICPEYNLRSIVWRNWFQLLTYMIPSITNIYLQELNPRDSINSGYARRTTTVGTPILEPSTYNI